jgi:methionine-rich copper-binding protein CopC
MVIRLVTASLALTILVMLALATPAMAHAELIGSNPADGASVDAMPRQVQLTFSEPVSPEEITVDSPQGTRWRVGQIAVEGSVVTVPVQVAGPAGGYTINYRVLSEDGDVVTGTARFTVTTAATAPPSGSGEPAAAPPDDGSVPGWVWIIGSIVVVAVAALAAGVLVARRSRDQQTADDLAESTEPAE